MQLTLELFSGKTCLASSVQQTMPSDAFSVAWWEQIPHSFQQEGSGGQTQVWLMDPNDPPLGASWMPNISDWPNVAAVCSLSQVLETGPIQRKYFLSAKACSGILRRAEKRGKVLPQPLMLALSAVAGHMAPALSAQADSCPRSDSRQALRSMCGGGGNHPAVAFTERTRAEGRTFESQEDLAYALTNPGSGGRTHSRQVMTPAMAVRRLTPTECERLQGFPDGYTAIPGAADGPRYRALGNSMAVPVIAWIGSRILEASHDD